MSRKDVTPDDAPPTSGVGRLRRPALERTEPRRGWGNLYAPGRADNSGPAATQRHAETPPADAGAAPNDAAARVVRDGYRIVEENLRRGRQIAAELRGAGREVTDAAGRVDAQGAVSSLRQALLDPALTEQLAGVARSFFSVLSAALPVPQPPAEPRVPLHPQERADFAAGGARVLKLRSVGPGEWLADLEVDGKVRRVQVRAVDGEL
jgi:hypothetical protein